MVTCCPSGRSLILLHWRDLFKGVSHLVNRYKEALLGPFSNSRVKNKSVFKVVNSQFGTGRTRRVTIKARVTSHTHLCSGPKTLTWPNFNETWLVTTWIWSLMNPQIRTDYSSGYKCGIPHMDCVSPIWMNWKALFCNDYQWVDQEFMAEQHPEDDNVPVGPEGNKASERLSTPRNRPLKQAAPSTSEINVLIINCCY